MDWGEFKQPKQNNICILILWFWFFQKDIIATGNLALFKLALNTKFWAPQPNLSPLGQLIFIGPTNTYQSAIFWGGSDFFYFWCLKVLFLKSWELKL